jgi:GAF domain-containing protein
MTQSQVRERDGVERLVEEQAALRRVAMLVARGAPPSEVFAAVAQEAAQVLHLPNAAVSRFDDDGATITVIAVCDERPHAFQPGSRWPLDGPSMSAQILRTGRPARVESYSGLAGTLAAGARESGFERTAGAPIVVDGRVWGVISTSSPDAPLPDDVEHRLAAFTELAATAISNGQAHEEITRLAEGQAALRRVATLVAEGVGTDELLASVADEVAGVVGLPGVTIDRYDTDGSTTTLAAHGEHIWSVGSRWPLDPVSLAATVLQTGSPARIDDYSDLPGTIAGAARVAADKPIVGVAAAPIIVDGKVWGMIGVGAKPGLHVPADTEARLLGFTELVGTAIAKGLARDGLTRLAEEQAALRRVATLVAEGAPPGAVFEAVVAEVGRLVPADAAALSRYETDDSVTIIGGWDKRGGYIPVGTRHPVGQGTLARLILDSHGHGRVESYADASGPLADVVRDRLSWRSAVGAPIAVEGGLWGLVAIASTTDEALPVGAEERLAQFAELLATAIANAESRGALTQLADEQAALQRVATLVARGVPPAELFEAVIREAGRLVGADAGALLRYEGGCNVAVMSSWTRTGRPPAIGTQHPITRGMASWQVLETRKPARVASYAGMPDPGAATARELGWQSAVATPVIVAGQLWGVAIVSSMTAEPLQIGTEQRLAQFTELVATAIANSEAREELTRLAEEQAGLRRVATLVAEGRRPTEVFQAVSAEVGRLVPADAAALCRFEADGTVTTLGGWTRTGTHEFNTGGGYALERGTAARLVRDTHRPARIEGYEGVRGAGAGAAREAGWRSTVAAPIVVEGGLWGVINVASTSDDPLPPDTEERLAEFTELLATAIANAESRAELDASRARIVATADATRRRIERDLHDGAQQQLVLLALELRAVQAAASPTLGADRAKLSHIAEGLTNVLDELREIALGIHPATLVEGGLGPALNTLAHRSPIPVELDVPPVGRLPEPVEVAAYYVVSEALTNAAKYARASVVRVTVEAGDSVLRVVVRDDGIGGADPTRGSGLLGLKDRAEAIGGSIALQSRTGAGTSLDVELPLDDGGSG